MADDSDGEYVEQFSDDDLADHQVTSGHDGGRVNSNTAVASQNTYGTRGTSSFHRPTSSKAPDRSRRKGDRKKKKPVQAWEQTQRAWDVVTEDAEGKISLVDFLEAQKRKRLLRDTTPLQRGIIRHLMLVLDASFAMSEKDLLPSRWTLMMQYAVDFVREYFEQNPISQLGIIAMRDGIAVRISEMSGNPADHVDCLRHWEKNQEPQGNPSLQNALEMCRGALFHAPPHGTREVLIIYGALLSSDPGDVHDTINSLVADRIHVSIVGLAAQVAICAELCARTNAGDDSTYSIALHEQHFRELFLATTTPPVTQQNEQNSASLLMMGFPSRTKTDGVLDAKGNERKDSISICACHNKPSRDGYNCTRCLTKVCRLPAECPTCGLTLILSTHLARSYHHLFPLRNWVEVSWTEAAKSVACHACLAAFPDATHKGRKRKGKAVALLSDKVEPADAAKKPEPVKGVSESGRYACEVCRNHFCIDCDVFAHEVVHNCPGCQSDTRDAARMVVEVNGNGNGNGFVHENGAMILD